MPTALNISILETLALLDGPFREFSDGVAEDAYAVWLGAGISLGKLPGLEDIAQDVIEYLRVRVDAADAACPWRDSLERILGLIGLTEDDWKAIDCSKPVAAWRDIKSIRKRLVAQYARMLDQHPIGERSDYLLWTAINVVGRYANPTITPGAEHIGLAALIIEGAASDIASANWDGLLEKAVELLAGPGVAVLQPRVLPEDVQNNLARARLYKFHGCAVLAGHNEAEYRPRLVGRASQIHGWAEKLENKVFAGKLLDLAISKPTLMLGLSAQDTNIQGIFVVAQAHLPATFPTHPPAVVLSEDRVGVDQQSLLRNFYKDDYDAQATAIEASALLRAYAQSLLPALWLYVIGAKLSAFVAQAAPHLPAVGQDNLRAALKLLRDAAAATAIPDEHERFVLQAVMVMGRAMVLFRDGHAPSGGAIYSPVTISAVTKSLGDPALPSSGLPQLALGLALLGRGQADRLWTCAISDPSNPKSGAIRVSGAMRTAEVFFAANAQAAVGLALAGHASLDDEAVILHSHQVVVPAARFPSAPPGRTGMMKLREFSLSSLAAGAVDLDMLLTQFKAEIAL
jgi:hypothetical protein